MAKIKIVDQESHKLRPTAEIKCLNNIECGLETFILFQI